VAAPRGPRIQMLLWRPLPPQRWPGPGPGSRRVPWERADRKASRCCATTAPP